MPKFFYITPYSTTSPPQIGSAINDNITRLNPSDDDWIIHIDQDACFLLPKDRKKLEIALLNCEYDVVGTLTNRLNTSICKDQVVTKMYDICDIKEHIEYAKSLGKGEFTPTNIVALVCMAFRYSYWKKVGGFKDTPQLDIQFTRKAKCAIYTGVYVFHVYRMYSDTNDVRHLIR